MKKVLKILGNITKGLLIVLLVLGFLALMLHACISSESITHYNQICTEAGYSDHVEIIKDTTSVFSPSYNVYCVQTTEDGLELILAKDLIVKAQ